MKTYRLSKKELEARLKAIEEFNSKMEQKLEKERLTAAAQNTAALALVSQKALNLRRFQERRKYAHIDPEMEIPAELRAKTIKKRIKWFKSKIRRSKTLNFKIEEKCKEIEFKTGFTFFSESTLIPVTVWKDGLKGLIQESLDNLERFEITADTGTVWQIDPVMEVFGNLAEIRVIPQLALI